MLKNKTLFSLTLFGAAAMSIFSVMNENFIPAFASSKVDIEENNLILDIYAEYDFKLLNYDDSLTYTWTSSDTNLATISNTGHLSCLGKVGEITITVASGKNKDTCSVSIKNQMINPSISVEDTLGFVNTNTKPNVEVRYDGNFYPLETYTLTSKDTTIATTNSNGEFFGVKEGEVDIEVNATWKGKTLKKKSFTATIQSENSIVLDKEVYEIYSVDETSPVRKNYVEIFASVYARGEKIDSEVGVNLGINTYLTSEGNKISVKNNNETSEPISFEVEVYSLARNDIKTTANVVLYPNFESKKAHEEIVETFRADLNFSYEEFKGHPNAYKYEITDHEMNKNTTNPTWSSWETRIEFYETTTKNGVVSYDYMMEKGYTLLSFDFYYCGQKGVLMGAYGAPSKQYFYNEVQVNRSDMLLVNSKGEATNILTNEEWFTVYFDISELVLKSMTIGQDAASLYVGPCYVKDVAYFDNIRYYYDYSPLNDIEITFDDEIRHLEVSENNKNKATSNNEMVVYSPSYVSYEYSEATSLYKYDSSAAKSVDREARSKINAYNLLNGYAVNKGYKYLAFDYIYRSGKPILYYFNNYTNSSKSILLDNSSTSNNFVKFYKDGKEINSIPVNEKINVVVRVDGKTSDSTYLTSSINTVFELGNFTYYKDTSYIEDYSYKAPFNVLVENVDTSFVNDTIDLAKQVVVIYKGKLVNANISGFIFSNKKATYLGGSLIKLNEVGNIKISFTVRVDDKHTTSSININIKDDSLLTLPIDNVSLYAGDKDYFNKEVSILPFAIFNKTLIEPENLNYELVNDNGVVSLNKNQVTAIKEGNEEIKVSLPDNSKSLIFKVEVFNKYRKGSFVATSLDASSPLTYEQVNQNIYGVDLPYIYSSNTASWNNKLDISETKHTTVSESKNNIINTHIDFITYKILLTNNTTLRAASVSPSGTHANIALGINTTINASNNTNIKVSDLEGKEVTTLKANTWYLITVDYSNFKNQYKSGYTCHELTYLKGSCYISDIRYYHDSIS